MALADPQSVTIDSVAVTLPNIGRSLTEGAYADATGEVNLSIRHNSARRTRHTVKLAKSLIVADPLVPSQNQNVSFSAHIVIDLPKNGIAVADATELANALVLWCTPANLAKVVGGES